MKERNDGILKEYLGSYAYVEIEQSDGFTEIGANAFANNKMVEKVVLPDGIVKIGEKAFNRCSLLKEIVLPKTLREIYPGAFYSCRGIKRVEIPDSIEGLSSDAFSDSTTVALGMRNRIRKKFGLIREISRREI